MKCGNEDVSNSPAMIDIVEGKVSLLLPLSLSPSLPPNLLPHVFTFCLAPSAEHTIVEGNGVEKGKTDKPSNFKIHAKYGESTEDKIEREGEYERDDERTYGES